MSRNYEAQVEVFPCAATERPTVMVVLGAWGMGIDCDTAWLRDDGDGWSFWGSIQLTSGETELEKHEELRALLPGKQIRSHWRWVDDQKWDEEFSSEPRPVQPAA